MGLNLFETIGRMVPVPSKPGAEGRRQNLVETETMTTTTRHLCGALAVALCAGGASAQYATSYNASGTSYSGSSPAYSYSGRSSYSSGGGSGFGLSSVDWSEKEFFALIGAQGSFSDFMCGGGVSFAVEFASTDIYVGLGARTGFNGWAGSDDLNWDYTDMTWDNDVWIPLRLSDEVTLYGGAGVTLHDMECKGLVESTSSSRSGRTRRYSWELKTVTYSHEPSMATHSWFIGLRWRVEDHWFVFAEFRQSSGTIEMSTDELGYYSKLKTIEADMDRSYVTVGLGGAF